MLKRMIVAGALLFNLVSNARAMVVFPLSGVWKNIRISQDGKFISNYLSMEPGEYTFKTKVEERDGELSTTSLALRISGAEDLYLQNPGWKSISLGPYSSSTRQITQKLKTPGDYNLSFELGNGNSISREINVIPELPGSVYFGMGAAGLVGLLAGREKRKGHYHGYRRG